RSGCRSARGWDRRLADGATARAGGRRASTGRLGIAAAGRGARAARRTEALEADVAALAEGRYAAGRRGLRLDALRGGRRRLVGRLLAQLAERRGRRGEPGLRVLHRGDGAGAPVR